MVTAVTVDMGKAELAARNIPIALDSERVIDVPVTIGEEEYRITGVSMGNPHCVVFQDNVDLMELDKIGPLFEYSPLFPERVNAEFVEVLGNNTLKIRVWERGSGETWACGTGACAAAVASVLAGYCEKDSDITVKLKGGELVIRYTDDTVLMTGAAKIVFEGETTI